MKITWDGPVGDNSGYGVASRNYARELMKLCDVKVVSIGGRYPDKEMAETRFKDDIGRIKIVHDIPTRPADVYYTVFEMNQAPKKWGKWLDEAKMVFTPSVHSVASLSTVMKLESIRNIRVIHHGVDFNEFNTDVKPASFIGQEISDMYKFLYVAEWVDRKRIPQLVHCFCEEFKADENICLLLKVHSTVVPVNRLIRKAMISGKENVFLLGGHYPSLAPIYRAVDCYVSSSSCEGWGETMSEAAACGIPIITGMNGGQTEFLRHDSNVDACFVRTHEEPIMHNDLEPTIEPWFRHWPLMDYDLKDAMRQAIKYPDDFKETAVSALENIKQFTWEAAAQKMIKCLEEIQ